LIDGQEQVQMTSNRESGSVETVFRNFSFVLGIQSWKIGKLRRIAFWNITFGIGNIRYNKFYY
jgi:hypothetical protein